jgi:type I restriction enzyme S subunit
MIEWQSAKLSELAETTDYVANGSFASLRANVTYKDAPDYAVLVRLVDHNAGWSNRFVYVDERSFNFLRKSRLVPGDIVIANVGANAGAVFLVPDLGTHMTLGPNAILCRPKSDGRMNREFLYYYLISHRGQASLNSIRSGSAQPKFNKTDLRSLIIPVPPAQEQHAIASMLRALDEKIELNRKMSATLEAIPRTLFKSWFVDFDPVHAKAEGRDTGLPSEIAALFPNSFEDSELGEIPKRWLITMLGDILSLEYGRALKAEDRHGGVIPVYGSNRIVGWHDTVLARGPGIVVGRKGNPGTVNWSQVDFFPIDTAFYVIPKNAVSPQFLFYALSTHDLARLGADSAVPGLNRGQVYMSKQVLPPAALLEGFSGIVTPIFARLFRSDAESATLAHLRDALLPRLISGEIRVHEAERIVEKTA